MRKATHLLTSAGVPDAAKDARRFMEAASGYAAASLIGRSEEQIPEAVQSAFDAFVARRTKRQPVSQILGSRAFFGRDFIVTGDVLDPRPETETLIEIALQDHYDRVLDMGTGSGAILVTLLAERPRARGVGTDINENAVLVAGDNAEKHGVADRIILPLSEWWDDVGGRYDLIVSNPPYISVSEMEHLQPEVRDWEPREALTDGADGLTAYSAIAKGAYTHLRPGGRLIVEIGYTQGEAVSAIFREFGFLEILTHPDLDGRDRVVSCRKPV